MTENTTNNPIDDSNFNLINSKYYNDCYKFYYASAKIIKYILCRNIPWET